MRFKQWLLFEDMPSMLHGGTYGYQPTNSSIPGIQSKYVTKENPKGQPPDSSPERLFGFRTKNYILQTKERQVQTIDRDKRRVPIRNTRLDTIF